MKKSIAILLFFISLSTKAQGNLQFNRVVNFSATQSVGSNLPITAQTFIVPTGKVWKIEYVMIAERTAAGGANFCQKCAGSFNGIVAYTCHLSGNFYENGKSPIWLSDGSYNFIISQNNSTTAQQLLVSYSAIEFNVIP
jgi:hypothetical protein